MKSDCSRALLTFLFTICSESCCSLSTTSCSFLYCSGILCTKILRSHCFSFCRSQQTPDTCEWPVCACPCSACCGSPKDASSVKIKCECKRGYWPTSTALVSISMEATDWSTGSLCMQTASTLAAAQSHTRCSAHQHWYYSPGNVWQRCQSRHAAGSDSGPSHSHTLPERKLG